MCLALEVPVYKSNSEIESFTSIRMTISESRPLKRLIELKNILPFSPLLVEMLKFNLYQEKVKPILVEKFPETNFNSDMNFIEALTPHLIIGSSIILHGILL